MTRTPLLCICSIPMDITAFLYFALILPYLWCHVYQHDQILIKHLCQTIWGNISVNLVKWNYYTMWVMYILSPPTCSSLMTRHSPMLESGHNNSKLLHAIYAWHYLFPLPMYVHLHLVNVHFIDNSSIIWLLFISCWNKHYTYSPQNYRLSV